MVRDHGVAARAVLVVPVVFLLVMFVVPVAAVFRSGSRPDRRRCWRSWVPGAPGNSRVHSSAGRAVHRGDDAAALPAAFVLATFRFPGRGLIRALVLVPFVMPTVVVAAAFLALIRPTGALGVDLSVRSGAGPRAHVLEHRGGDPRGRQRPWQRWTHAWKRPHVCSVPRGGRRGGE